MTGKISCFMQQDKKMARAVQERFSSYLDRNRIRYTVDINMGTTRITMLYMSMDYCPDKILESCIWFYPDAAEVRVYYNENGASWCANHKENHPQLFRLLNFLNARLWVRGMDFASGQLYFPEYLYTPRIYMTEDESCDISLTFMVNYDFYGLTELETNDFITAACPDLMNALSPFIFGVLLDQMSADEAIHFINKTLLKN